MLFACPEPEGGCGWRGELDHELPPAQLFAPDGPLCTCGGLLKAVTVPPSAPEVSGWTAADLLMCEFPAPSWIVEELLAPGLTFLGGRPKVGKSWLALDLVRALQTPGAEFLGRKVSP